MMKTYMRSFALLLAIHAGCGGDDEGGDDVGDGGSSSDGGDASLPRPDGGDAEADTTASDGGGGRLMPGKYAYSNIVKLTDGCDLGLELPVNAPDAIPLVNTGEEISLGQEFGATPVGDKPGFDPPGYSLGTGPYTSATTASLDHSARVTFDDDCVFDTQRLTLIEYTANNTVSVNFTDTRSNFSSECEWEGDVPCTSQYTFTLTRTGDLE